MSDVSRHVSVQVLSDQRAVISEKSECTHCFHALPGECYRLFCACRHAGLVQHHNFGYISARPELNAYY